MTARIDLLDLLDLRRVGDDSFTAATPGEGRRRLFGGQVASQSLRAAALTVDPSRPPHSFHAYFIRPGTVNTTLHLEVERTRDGRSFTTRQVTASQEGKPIFILAASFHGAEDGVDWQLPAPAGVPDPEALPPRTVPAPFLSWTPFDIRPAGGSPEGFPVAHPLWVRSLEPMPDDPVLHLCTLAFISDIGVAPNGRAPGGDAWSLPYTGASLDHAVWFHRPVRADEWILFWTRPVSNYGSRALSEGAMHTADGVRVASIAQESLLRHSGVRG